MTIDWNTVNYGGILATKGKMQRKLVRISGRTLDPEFDQQQVKEYGEAICPDCGIELKPGNYHVWHCDQEVCPMCRGQLLSCTCNLEWEMRPVPLEKANAG